MSRHRSFFALGILAYVSAWFVRVIAGGVALPDGLPGWEAFSFAAQAAADTANDARSGILAGLSAATNIVMASILLARVVPRLRTRWWPGAALVSFLINAQWVATPDRATLRTGYYLWWSSFLIVGWALMLERRQGSAHAGSRPVATVTP